MPLAGIITLVGVGLVVAALAIYLITVAALLTSVSSKLTAIIDRLWGITASAEPLNTTVSSINRDLQGARQALHSAVLQQQSTRQKASRPRRARTTAASA